jgi:phosphoribosylaminoimidazole-succinocarboxamide synthase
MMQLAGQTDFYKGKVRDVYTINDKYLVMVVSDRISAFDVVLPKPIPYKGHVLNQIAAIFLEATKDIVPNWLITTPLPNAAIGYKCKTYPVEMVVRGNLTGHAWRTYKSGARELCGVVLPEGMNENDFFPSPIITPTTKAHEGHDEDISREEIIRSGLIPEDEYVQLEKYALALFQRGCDMAKDRGLILVDTKYEFGKLNDTIYLIDEIHTPDSSRYFYAEGYEERQRKGEPQKQLSKEFVREWLMENGFQGKEGQQVPEMTEEVVGRISERYIELFEVVAGRTFQKHDVNYADQQRKIEEALAQL